MDIALDKDTHDLAISGGELSLVTATQAIDQNLRVRLKLVQSEIVYNTSLGVPYFRDILIKNPNTNTVVSILRDAILSVQGVAEIETLDVSFDRATRTINVAFEVRTDDGSKLTYGGAL